MARSRSPPHMVSAAAALECEKPMSMRTRIFSQPGRTRLRENSRLQSDEFSQADTPVAVSLTHVAAATCSATNFSARDTLPTSSSS